VAIEQPRSCAYLKVRPRAPEPLASGAPAHRRTVSPPVVRPCCHRSVLRPTLVCPPCCVPSRPPSACILPPRRPRSGEPRPAPAARDPRPAAASAAALRPRPRLLGRPREALARLARHARHRAARHRHPLAPPRIPPLLALAVAPDRTPLDKGRHADVHPSHRLREPPAGARRESTASCSSSASPSPSPTVAKYMPRRNKPSLADLAHVPAQPHELRRRHRLLHDPDGQRGGLRADLEVGGRLGDMLKTQERPPAN
jgi:hypothetical protein